jgi:hypothetical protein
MRCVSCGARNAETADWCTQCYVSLRGRPADPVELSASSLAPSSEPESSEQVPSPPPPSRPVAPAPTGAHRDVRDHDGDVQWRCERCDTWSPLLAPSCTTCGGPRHGFGEGVASPADREVSPGSVTALSVALPGAGHLLVGRIGTGSARLLLWVLWLVGGLSTVRGAGSGTLALPGVVLLVGAAVLWAATLVDVQHLTAGRDREVLGTRPLLWLVGGVVSSVVLAVFVAALLAG